MKLRSPWNATHIADPRGEFSLDAYVTRRGLRRSEPVPLDSFIDYGLWFQRSAVPDLDRRKVVRVESPGSGFRAMTADGAWIHADRVVVATGLATQTFRPPAFADVPAQFASHACDHSDLSVFSGRRVAVVGRGQSACESAVLLHEAGAEVDLICRSEVHWLGGSSRPGRAALQWLSSRLASPSGVGPFPLNWLVEMPDAARLMPPGMRAQFNARCLRPGAAGWLRPRFGGVTVRAGEHIDSAAVTGDGIALKLRAGMVTFDHVLLGTGYQIDIEKLGILDADLVARVRCSDGAPRLGAGFESSVPGLHFVGASAVASYGPLMRFIAGTGFAARKLTERVLENRVYAPPTHRRTTARSAASGRADTMVLENFGP